MKPIQNALVIVLFLISGMTCIANPNQWTGAAKGSFWNNWAININGGYASYFGDLSIYDSDVINKIKHESKPAFGFLLTKYFTDEVGLSGQFFYGGLKSRYNENLSFDTDFFEYNVQLRVDVLNLIFRKNNSGIGVIAFGGFGHLIFNSTKYSFVEGEMKTYSHRAQSPEFVYFLGGGIEYSISNRFSVNLDAAIRQVQNDRIDNEIRKDNNDFYSYFSVGVSYHLFRLFGKSKKSNLYRRGVRMAHR